VKRGVLVPPPPQPPPPPRKTEPAEGVERTGATGRDHPLDGALRKVEAAEGLERHTSPRLTPVGQPEREVMVGATPAGAAPRAPPQPPPAGMAARVGPTGPTGAATRPMGGATTGPRPR
jgi:hypothetical protein